MRSAQYGRMGTNEWSQSRWNMGLRLTTTKPEKSDDKKRWKSQLRTVYDAVIYKRH
jgi:hypothetical protein